MKNDSTSFFENNHFANSYVYDISISHVPAYFGLHWHHYIEIVLAQDNGIIYEVNGEAFPMPGRHPTLMVATLVDSARNTAGTVVGQKIGRDQYKIDSLFWPHLKADQWARILQAFSNFYVDVQFPDMVHLSLIHI